MIKLLALRGRTEDSGALLYCVNQWNDYEDGYNLLIFDGNIHSPYEVLRRIGGVGCDGGFVLD